MGTISRALRAALFAATAAGVLTIGASANPPVEAFGNLPEFDGWRISPDAKHIAVLQPQNGKNVALIYTVGAQAGTKPIAYGSDDGIVREVRWAGNDRLLVAITKNMQLINESVASEHPTWVSIDLNAQNPVSIPGTLQIVDADDPTTAYVLGEELTETTSDTENLNAKDRSILSVYQVRTNHPAIEISERGKPETINWVLDEHGHAVARVDENTSALQDTVYTRAAGDWTPAMTFDVTSGGLTGAIVVGEMYDGPFLALQTYGSGDTLRLNRVSLDGKSKTTIFTDPNYDIDSVLADDWTGKVIGVHYFSNRPVDVYFDPLLEALQKGLEAAFAGNNVSIISHDRTGTKFIVAVEGPRQPTAFVLYDRATKNASVIANTYTKLMPADLGAEQPYSFKARDGLTIHGYLTLPPGSTSPKNLPMIVFPHGGPEERDSIGFDWIAQFFASRGYLVFQPNFRGSTGYGSRFHQAGDGQWGKGMINDIADGTKALVAEGTADRNRICIVGASYGGYAALAEATFEPDLYKCAVSYAGVSDVNRLLAFDKRGSDADFLVMANQQRLMGGQLGDSVLDAISPADHADQVKIPILLVHADHDTTVPIDQSNEEEAALKKAGKPVEYDRIPGDDHYFSTAASRIEFLKRTEAFLAKYLGY